MLNDQWKTSSRSGNGGNCVEARSTADVNVRDSKDRQGPVLTFDRAAWSAFLDGVKSGAIN